MQDSNILSNKNKKTSSEHMTIDQNSKISTFKDSFDM